MSVGTAVIGLAVGAIAGFAVGSVSGLRSFGGVEIFHFESFFAGFGPELRESIIGPGLRMSTKLMTQNGPTSHHNFFTFPNPIIQKLDI